MTVIYLKEEPISKKRPKFRKVGGFVQVYDGQDKDKKITASLLKDQWIDHPIKGILKLKITFCMPIPESYSKKKKIALINQPHDKKPDLDNMLKYILDCMNGIVFEDDRQIWELSSKKIYAETPQTIIEIING